MGERRQDAWMDSLWAQTFCLRGDDGRTHFWKRRGRKMKGWAVTLWIEEARSDNGALIIPQAHALPTSLAPIHPSLGLFLDNRPKPTHFENRRFAPYHPYQIPATVYGTNTVFNTSTPVSDTSHRTSRTTATRPLHHPFPQCTPVAPAVCSQQLAVHMTTGCASCTECSLRWDRAQQH